jgi:hypothetical protein
VTFQNPKHIEIEKILFVQHKNQQNERENTKNEKNTEILGSPPEVSKMFLAARSR